MDKILALVDKLVATGRTKMLVALGSEGAIFYLILKDKVDGFTGVIVIGTIAFGYFIMRHFEQINKPEEK